MKEEKTNNEFQGNTDRLLTEISNTDRQAVDGNKEVKARSKNGTQ